MGASAAGAVLIGVLVTQADTSSAPAAEPLAAPVEIAPPELSEAPRTPLPVADEGHLAALARVPEVLLYEGPEATDPVFAVPNPTHEGFPLSFSVIEERDDRLHVRVPMRPNNATVWIDAADVDTFPVAHHIVVDVSDRTLTAYEGDEVVMHESVAVGSPATPTPLGDFFIDISIPEPGSPYGAHMLSVAGFSDQLLNFGGGIGQIAIHGWSDTSAMGNAVSNGCVRMPDGTITHLAEFAGVGTPVHVQA